MISAVKGSVFEISPGELHLNIGNGLVLRILYPVSNYAQIKKMENPLLYTILKIKEEDPIVYGFLHKKDKILFEKLISISGVGGKTALSLISAFSVEELVEAIDNGNLAKISSIPGIGKKTAQRIVLELTGKLEFGDPLKGEAIQLREDLISGLVNFGYPVKGVRDLVGRTLRDNPDSDSFEVIFKQLLRKISKQ